MNETAKVKGFKILHLNIRSLWRNHDELFVQFKGFDLIALSETWLHSLSSNTLIAESGYSIIRQDRAEGGHDSVKSKGGGLLLYVKDCYFDCISKINPISKHLEQLWLTIDIQYRRKIIMGICYRPPSGICNIAVSEITTVLDSFNLQMNADILLLGDFNINYSKRTTCGFKELKDMERKYLIQQKITTPTRVNNNSKSTIDLLFTDIEHIYDVGTLDVDISDHFPIYMIIKKTKCKKTNTSIIGRSYKNYNLESFQESIISHPLWQTFWGKENVDDQWSIMLSIINTVLDLYCPVKNLKVYAEGNEWLTSEVLEAILEKKRLHKVACKSSKL